MKRRYYIKSKIRFTLFLLFILLIVLLTTTTVLGINRAGSDPLVQPTYITVEVKQGDTLWGLASQYGPKGHDVRKVIDEICEINNLSAAQLQSGQHIRIPNYF